jgi:hypothetical protein
MDSTFRTNRYNQHLFDVIGVSGDKRSFQAGICLISSAEEESYQWILEQYADLRDQNNIEPPRVIATDREQALINAIESTHQHTNNILCRWHTNKDVLAWLRKRYKMEKDEQSRQWVDSNETNRAMLQYHECIDAKSEELFRLHCHVIEVEKPEFANYL